MECWYESISDGAISSARALAEEKKSTWKRRRVHSARAIVIADRYHTLALWRRKKNALAFAESCRRIKERMSSLAPVVLIWGPRKIYFLAWLTFFLLSPCYAGLTLPVPGYNALLLDIYPAMHIHGAEMPWSRAPLTLLQPARRFGTNRAFVLRSATRISLWCVSLANRY